MKRNQVFVALFLMCVFAIPAFAEVAGEENQTTAPEAVSATEATSSKEIVIADFNTGDKPNNLGGDFGAWDKDPSDETQSCKMSFESSDALDDATGYSIRLDYDVDSSNPAYNGFWMKLNSLDATAYNTVNFYMRGDSEKGFSKRVKIELKDSSEQSSPYIVTGITDQFQKFSIPFDKFKKVQHWDALNEFVVVFDDINSNPKSGTIYLDQVTVSAE